MASLPLEGPENEDEVVEVVEDVALEAVAAAAAAAAASAWSFCTCSAIWCARMASRFVIFDRRYGVGSSIGEMWLVMLLY